MSKNMKVLLLPEESFKYLMFVFEQHMRSGIPSEEVFAAADFKTFLNKAGTVDFSKLGKADIEKLNLGQNGGIAVNLTPETPTIPVGDENNGGGG